MVVFTGAGISTESGIPDFRSPGGIWTPDAAHRVSGLSSPIPRRGAVSWQRRFEMEETWRSVQPNDGHEAIAELVARGKASHVITQNIDDLHQVSGVPDEQVIELHGNTRHAKCLDCGARGGDRRRSAPISKPMARRPIARPAAACEDRHDLLRPVHAGSRNGARRRPRPWPATSCWSWAPRWWSIRRRVSRCWPSATAPGW